MADYSRLPLAEIQAGMVLARQVLDGQGRVLLPQGAVLTDALISRLVERGVGSVPVLVDRGPRGHFKPVIQEPRHNARVGAVLRNNTFQDALGTYRSVLQTLEGRADLDVGTAYNVVDTMLEEILTNLDVVSALTTLKHVDEYTYRHSVGACLVALTVGVRMQYDRLTLRDIGLAALLMDVGMLRVPRNILQKPGRLSPEEWAIMQQHVEWGHQILRTTRGIRPLIATVVYQHHERWNGTGYPRGLDGHAIHPYAQFVALADVYDAMTSDRPNGVAQPPFLVADYLLSLQGRLFEPELCRNWIANLMNYKPGVVVEISGGRRGQVVARNPVAPTRPLVTLLDAEGNPTGEEIDLAGRRDLHPLRLVGDSLTLTPSQPGP